MTKILIAIALSLIAIPAMAQTAVISAQIPFAFHAGDTTLPAGSYLFEVVSPQLLKITNKATRAVATVLTPTPVGEARPLTSSKLVFNRYGDEFFFAESWWAGRSTGNAAWKTEYEARLARNLPRVRVESVTARR